MATFTKIKLSGSTDGRGIKVATVSTPGTLIHTAVASTTVTTWDEVWLYAYNSTTISVTLVIELGGVNVPDDNVGQLIPPKSGRLLIVDGQPLQNSSVVRAFSGTTNVIAISGFVNTIV